MNASPFSSPVPCRQPRSRRLSELPAATHHCAVDVAPVRADPRHDSEQVTQLLRGEPVTVDDRRADWVRIRTAYDYPGWVLERSLSAGSRELRRVREGAPVELAREYLGAPYEWGGMTRRGIDCSGLVHMSYRESGRLIPRDAADQEDAGTHVSPADARRGDLVTYGEADKKNATHIAFWLGDGLILHSTERDGVNGVVEELEPLDLAARRRVFVRL